MSRFYRGAMDSDSDSSESSGSDDEMQQQVQTKKVPIGRDFAYPSDDEVEERRVVRAHKDRKYEELKGLIKKTKNAKNVKDFSKLYEIFEELCKAFEKAKPILRRQNAPIPRFYVRYLVELEDFVEDLWKNKEAKQALSKPNANGLTRLHQRVRKHAEAHSNAGMDLVLDCKNYRENPDPVGYESPEEEVKVDEDEKDESDDDMSGRVPVPAAVEKESDSDEWSTDTETSTSESEIDFSEQKMEELRKYFLKKEFQEPKKKDDKPGKSRPQKIKDKIVIVSEDEDDEGWTEVGKKEEDIGVLFPPKTEITLELLIEKFDEKMSTRGRKTTNRKSYVRILQELYNIAQEKKFGAGILVKILFNIVSALFELTPSVSDCMEFATWNKTLTAINSLVDLLIESNVHLSIGITEEDENISNSDKPYKVSGSVLMSLQRLDTELTKILQNADCHSTDYIEKLRGEKDICQLIEKIQKFVDERREKGLFENDEVCKSYVLRIEHMYYKYEDTLELEEGVKASQLMEELCGRIYMLDDEKRLRQRAMLCHVYFLALHDEWQKAKDLMLMSHLQAIVDHSDVSTQILYNRTICQLGLCAFRHGQIKDAHQGLSEIQNTQRAKELLAQGIAMRQHERTQEQEKLERSRQVPYHMHINIELMECVYLICSMLLEIPHLASHEFELRKRLLSRSFHYQLKQNEKSSLVGPPENTREHVVAASRAMLDGKWEKCKNFIVNEKMDAKVWNLFRNAEKVKEMVVQRIQEESLRTYLLKNATAYITVSLAKLSKLFQLEDKHVHAIISKMIISEELAATLDEPSNCLTMNRIEPSRLQLSSLQWTDKLNQMADQIEQIMEPRGAGGRGYTAAWYPGRGGDRGDDKKKMQTFQSGRSGEQRGKGGVTWGGGVGGGVGATGQQRRPNAAARKAF